MATDLIRTTAIAELNIGNHGGEISGVSVQDVVGIAASHGDGVRIKVEAGAVTRLGIGAFTLHVHGRVAGDIDA